MTKHFSDQTWQSHDGLTLHFRDYPARGPDADDSRPPVICLHGLTRNGRDFGGLAEHVSAQGWRVLTPDVRGRGKSEYAADSSTYAVPTYVGDLIALLDQQAIERFVAIGTSMGGLMTMVLATIAPHRIAGAMLNDIGPVIETSGLDAIKSYVGQGRSFDTWMHAARSLQELQAVNFPEFALEDWLTMAKRGMALHSNGRIAFDYDMKIAEPILHADAAAVPPDLWPAYEALSGKPLLLVRGALSQLFSADTFEEMQRRIPQATAITVPQIGHAPTLDEPVVRDAIDALLADVE